MTKTPNVKANDLCIYNKILRNKIITFFCIKMKDLYLVKYERLHLPCVIDD